MPAPLRPALAAVLRLLGERRKAALFEAGGRKSAYDYWQVVLRRDAMRRRFLDYFQAQQLDALLSPPLGLPAVPHLTSNPSPNPDPNPNPNPNPNPQPGAAPHLQP